MYLASNINFIRDKKKYILMVYIPIVDEKTPSPLRNFMEHALLDITGEKISCVDIGPSSNLLSCLSQKIARDMGLDSCDVAQWIKISLKEYWVSSVMKKGAEADPRITRG